MMVLFVTRVVLTISILIGFFISMVALWLVIINSRLRSRVIAWVASQFCRCCLFLIGVKVSVTGEKYYKHRPYFIVANHLSYLDALFISSTIPSLFVTSVEIGSDGFLGWLCRLGRCILVERRSIWNLKSEVAEIQRSLSDGFNVVVFPEATTTDGTKMLPFKSSLLQAAVNAGADVLPICINYRKDNGKKTSIARRDSIFWYGDMTFTPHLFQLLRLRSVSVELQIVDVLPFEKGVGRKQITGEAYKMIHQNYMPVIT